MAPKTNMELLRYKYEDETLNFLEETSSIILGICDRGLEGFQHVLESGFITEENNAIVFLFRNFLAILDAITEAARVPSIENIQVLSRSLFEIKCNLEFMTGAEINERAIAYQVYYIREKIKQYQKLDEGTALGKEFATKWSKDRTFSSMKKTNYDTKDAIANLEKQLKSDPWKAMNDRFDLLGRKCEWYTIHSGKTSFYGLCEYLGYPISYDFFYGQWSALLHGKSAYKDNIANQDGTGGIEAIRSLSNYKTLIGTLIPIVMECYFNVFKSILPDYRDRMVRYYVNILKPKLDSFNLVNIAMVDP